MFFNGAAVVAGGFLRTADQRRCQTRSRSNSDQPFIDMHAGQRQHRGHDADDHEWRQQHDQRAAAREYAGTVDVRRCPRRPQTEMRPPVGISTKWINSWMMTAAAATPVAAKNPAKPFMGDPNGTVWPSAIDQPMQTSTVATAPNPRPHPTDSGLGQWGAHRF